MTLCCTQTVATAKRKRCKVPSFQNVLVNGLSFILQFTKHQDYKIFGTYPQKCLCSLIWHNIFLENLIFFQNLKKWILWPQKNKRISTMSENGANSNNNINSNFQTPRTLLCPNPFFRWQDHGTFSFCGRFCWKRCQNDQGCMLHKISWCSVVPCIAHLKL